MGCADGVVLMVLAGHGASVRSACYSPDGERIVTAWTTRARVWGRADRSCWPCSWVTAMESVLPYFRPMARRSVQPRADKTAWLYDARTGRQLAVLGDHADAVEWIGYSPDGSRIITASDDNTARIWNARSVTPLGVLVGHGVRIYSAAYSPHGQRIVTAADDNTAQIWNAASGAPLALLGGQVLADHGDSVFWQPTRRTQRHRDRLG